MCCKLAGVLSTAWYLYAVMATMQHMHSTAARAFPTASVRQLHCVDLHCVVPTWPSGQSACTLRVCNSVCDCDHGVEHRATLTPWQNGGGFDASCADGHRCGFGRCFLAACETSYLLVLAQIFD